MNPPDLLPISRYGLYMLRLGLTNLLPISRSTNYTRFHKSPLYFKIRIIGIKIGFDKSALYFKIRTIHVKVGFNKSTSYCKIYELCMLRLGWRYFEISKIKIIELCWAGINNLIKLIHKCLSNNTQLQFNLGPGLEFKNNLGYQWLK